MRILSQPREALLCVLFFVLTTTGFAAGHTVSFTNQNNVSCFANCNGSVSAIVTGGTGPFSYMWSPTGGTTATAVNLCSGMYTVTVTDQSDMSVTSNNVVITQPTPLVISLQSFTPANCWQSNGSATVTVSGGVGPYTYMWSPAGGPFPTMSNMPAGTYTCTVVDANGCAASLSVTINNLPGPVVTMNNSSSICVGQSVVFTPGVTGGTSPYTYMWSPGIALSSTSSLSTVASPTVTTTYTLTVTDVNGCASIGTVTVFVNASFTTTVGITPATCNQANGGAVVSIVSGGTAPFTYTWSNSMSGTTISSVAAGSYTVNITDASGCSNSNVANIPNNGGPAVTASVLQDASCANYANGMATAQASGNAPPFSYNWLTNPAILNDTAVALLPGTYTVQVTDNAGCISFGQTTVNQLAGNLYLYASAMAASNCNTPTGQAYSMVQGGTPPYTWLWSNNVTTQNLVNVAAGSYSVMVADANGCSQTGSLTIGSFCETVVRGKYYNDINNNCIFDSGDGPASYTWLQMLPGGYFAYANANGDYEFHAAVTGVQTIAPYGPLNGYYTTLCPSNGIQTINIATIGDTVSGVDFGRSPIPGIQDLQASLSSGTPRPGFTQNYNITYKNVGTVAMSDTLFFWHDPILNVISSTPPMDNYTGNRGYWLFNNFLPGQVAGKTIIMQVPTIPNGGYLGRQLISSVLIEPTATDTTPIDNGDDEVDIIVGSWDPNLKEVWAPGINASGDILLSDTLLAYTIGFQNTGTDTAFTVVVKDTLPAQLDITTLMPGASSHPYTLELQTLQNGQNELTFSFFNILLADSFVNEPASHGHVKFRIKRMPGLPVGTVISNTAHNYFDFNPPVATNTLNTMIVQPLGAAGNNSAENITVFPNPFNENTTLILDKTQEFNVELFDLSGRRVMQSGKQNSNRYIIKRNGLESGVYICRIISPGQPVHIIKLIIR